MRTFVSVIEAFGGAAHFAAELAIPASHARVMKWRDSIPPRYWSRTVNKAAALGIQGVTYEILAAIAARRSSHRRSPAVRPSSPNRNAA